MSLYRGIFIKFSIFKHFLLNSIERQISVAFTFLVLLVFGLTVWVVTSLVNSIETFERNLIVNEINRISEEIQTKLLVNEINDKKSAEDYYSEYVSENKSIIFFRLETPDFDFGESKGITISTSTAYIYDFGFNIGNLQIMTVSPFQEEEKYLKEKIIWLGFFVFLSLYLLRIRVNNKLKKPLNKIIENLEYYHSDEFKRTRTKKHMELPGNELDKISLVVEASYQYEINNLQKEDELKIAISEAVKEKNIFIAAMAHDYRTPIITLKGCLNNLWRDHVGDSKEFNKNYILAKSIAEDFDVMIDNTLDIAKIESNQPVQIKNEWTTPFDLITSIINPSQTNAIQKGLFITFTNENASTCEIYLDNNKFKQVLRNLINNSIKFSKKGFIKVRVKIKGGFLITSVTDSGMGMPDDFKLMATSPFKKLQNDGSQGLGLGLTLCKYILEQYGENLIIQNNPHSNGTKISFKMPVQVRKSEIILKGKCLIVSDEREYQDYLNQISINKFLLEPENETAVSLIDLSQYQKIIFNNVKILKDKSEVINHKFPIEPVHLTKIIKKAKELSIPVTLVHNNPKDNIKKSISLFELINNLEVVENIVFDKIKEEFSDISILLVDDFEVYADLFEEKLREMGFKNIDRASNGLEAIEFNKDKNGYDVILIDHMMPVMKGPEASLNIKRKYPRSIIIGFSAVEQTVNAAPSAMDRVFVKDWSNMKDVVDFFTSRIRRD